MEFNFQKLAEETFSLGEEIGKEREEELRPSIVSPEASPGLIFRIAQSTGTFCLRGVASNNLKEDHDSLFSGDEHIVEGLDLQSEECLQDIQFFPLDSFDLALDVEESLLNKRIPYEEELICNISDPGFCWWMDLTYPGIKIYFHSFCVEDRSKVLKLGPLGDSYQTSDIINSSIEYLSYMLPIDEFSCTDKAFLLSSQDPNHPCFMQLKSMFKNGESFDVSKYSSLECNEVSALQNFCDRMSAFRKVWQKVEYLVQQNREVI